MKAINILLLSLICSNIFSQEIIEKEIKTEVKEVTVFLKSAQVTRKKSINLPIGKTVVKFINLSPFVDAKSIQVKAKGAVTVHSVNHHQNYPSNTLKAAEILNLENRIEQLDEKISIENTHITIIREELNFLEKNINIGTKEQIVDITNLQEASEFYGSKLTKLRLREITRHKNIKELNKQKADIRSQINTISTKQEFSTGVISVTFETKLAKQFPIELSYIVGNASWFPSYDIRAKNINEPVEVVYKANVKQDTKVDWLNAKLKFSSANPNVSGVAPQLKTYFLDYYSTPPSYYTSKINSVSGKVLDNQNIPIPGVSIVVDGTSIGTVSDMQGNYSLTIPHNSSHLSYSFIGYTKATRPISSETMSVYLQENRQSLDEVVAVGYGSSSNIDNALAGSVAGMKAEKKNKGTKNWAVPTTQKVNQTTVDFEINTPYTVKSDNKSYTVDMQHYNLPAFYQYYAIPKIQEDAFLIANIVDWEKYNLMEGEANLFFEDTYLGKTLLDVRYATDTLEISLGRDKMVSVRREKIQNIKTKQFIGNKKEETRAYKTVVKNNKNTAINMIVLDQVPVSTVEEIEVNSETSSGAVHDVKTGEIKWQFKLQPNTKEELELKFGVKYPKNKSITIE